jgi:hypothetical protein
MLNQFISRGLADETPDQFRERCIWDGVENLKRARPTLEAIKSGERLPYRYESGRGIVEYTEWRDKDAE